MDEANDAPARARSTGRTVATVLIVGLAIASVVGAVYALRYDLEGRFSEGLEVPVHILGWTLLGSAAADVETARRWWAGRRTTKLLQLVIALPLFLVALGMSCVYLVLTQPF